MHVQPVETHQNVACVTKKANNNTYGLWTKHVETLSVLSINLRVRFYFLADQGPVLGFIASLRHKEYMSISRGLKTLNYSKN